MEKIYKETEGVVRTNRRITEDFYKERGVRQGCVMSPLLFNVYMTELEEMKSNGIGGIGIVHKRI